MPIYKVIGVMSGTSLDGLDLAYSEFEFEEDRWKFKIPFHSTIKYSDEWTEKLRRAKELSEEDLGILDHSYGDLIGKSINDFIREYKLTVDFVSSHGHTVYHDPSQFITMQIGSGKVISETTALPVINDFRRVNVLSGGQGAPLVPIGDLLLFPEYSACLNLGGIANISMKTEDSVIAFDIAVCNIAFNHYATLLGLNYDEDGKIGRSGQLNHELLEELNALAYFQEKGPKSLDASFFSRSMLPILKNSGLSPKDQLRTCYEHLAHQIASSQELDGNILITGGGAHNLFLIELLSKLKLNTVIPEDVIIEQKESMIFAFLGVLRYRNEINCLASVTGAPYDMCTGEMHGFH